VRIGKGGLRGDLPHPTSSQKTLSGGRPLSVRAAAGKGERAAQREERTSDQNLCRTLLQGKEGQGTKRRVEENRNGSEFGDEWLGKESAKG